MNPNKRMHVRFAIIVLLQIGGLAALFFHFRKAFQEVVEDSTSEATSETNTTQEETDSSVQTSESTPEEATPSGGKEAESNPEVSDSPAPVPEGATRGSAQPDTRLEPNQIPVLRGILDRFKKNAKGEQPQGNLSKMLAHLAAAGLPAQPRQEGHPSTGLRLRLFAQATRNAQPRPTIGSYSAALSMPPEAKDSSATDLQDLDLIREDVVVLPAEGQSRSDLFLALKAEVSREFGPARSEQERSDDAAKTEDSAQQRFARWNAVGGYHMWLYVEEVQDAMRRMERLQAEGLQEKASGAPSPGVRLTLEADIH